MYNDIKLEKGLYSINGKTFTQALEQLDPDSAYENTDMAGLDAFERQLKRFNIKVRGESCDRVEKFFENTQSAVLFPEFVRRAIKAGMDGASILGKVVAAVTYTDGLDHRGLTVVKGGNTDVVEQGGELPVTTVRLASTPSQLTKFARKLSCSYEAIRKQRLEAFAVILRNLGASLARDINGLCMEVAADGAQETTLTGDITYAALAEFWGSMGDNDMTAMVCKPELMAQILGLSEMKYCVGDYMSGGVVKTPYGVTLIKCPQLGDVQALGIDKSSAIEAVFGTDVVVDFDKLISTQCSEIACSVTVGFSKLTDGAVRAIAD